MYLAQKSILTSSVTLAMLFAVQVHADETSDETVPVLATIVVKAEAAIDPYVATKATSVLKSDAPLFETAQSVSVLTQEQLNQKQALTLNEALQGVSGVTAGYLGRRGFDDVIIRGQISTDNIFIDGLRMSKDMLNAIDLSGMDQLQVVKGPTSVGFGLVQPGGLINAVSKRPQDQSFARADLTYGSYALTQGTFDLNYAPNDTEKGAFRIVGRVSDQNDPTDYVYFKNYYISPSYNFNLGEKTDLSVIASYQHREYVRQQGLPLIGTVIANPYATYSLSRLLNEPDNIYKYDTYRIGYNFSHIFDNDWTFKQNFSTFQSDMKGSLLAFRGFVAGSNNTQITRRVNFQDRNIESYALDNQLQKKYSWKQMEHDIQIGVDGMIDQLDSKGTQSSNAGNNLDLNNPVYGVALQNITSSTYNVTDTRYVGLYLRDRMKFNDHIILNLAGRHDWAEGKATNKINNSVTKTSDSAFTGNASLMYLWSDVFAPYVSYATSFMPQTGTDYSGRAFDPEEGKQIEVGLKLQSSDQKLQGSLSWFDLRKKNVQTDDPVNDGYSILVGEQMSRGIESDVVASLNDQWNVSANYSYIPDAKVTKDTNTSNIGTSITQIPKHAFALSSQYYFDPAKSGWNMGASLRYVGDRNVDVSGVANISSVTLPDYTVYDVNVGYEAQHWGANLTVKNVFDKNYYTGVVSPTLSGGVVALGDPRQINFTVKFKY